MSGDETRAPDGVSHVCETGRIAEAARWLAAHDERALPGPTTRVLREAFGLRFNDACKAIAEARRLGGRG